MRLAFYFTYFTLLSGFLSAQTNDYKIYRKQNQHPTCTVLDSVIVNQILNELLVIDTNQFDANLDDYYQDLGMAYYQVYISRQDTTLLRNALSTYLKIKEFTGTDYWNMMHIHCILGECQKGNEYLQLYREVTTMEIPISKEEEILRIQRKCQITSQLHIEIQTYEQNGVKKAAAMAWQSPNSAYSAFKRRFDYVILNTPALHTKEQAAERSKLFSLYPDTLAIKAEYKRLLYLDTALSFNLLTMMSAIDAAGEAPKKTKYSKQELFKVASRFFYIDSVFADSTFQTHICIGINGVDQINRKKDLTLLAAFCYEAIFTDFDKEVSAIDEVFDKHKKELEQKIRSGEINMTDLIALRYELYTLMAKDHVFQKVLLDTYNQNKFNLAFKIKSNKAVFHLIPSVN
jgi:hypothetical protein